MTESKTDPELAAFVLRHGARVRRKEAMQLLAITSKKVWRKVVDAHPDLRHRLDGEGQCKYLTAVIYRLRDPQPGVRPQSGGKEHTKNPK